jgi:hypothetical protein
MNNTSILWFSDEACMQVRSTGGKGASLARMTEQGLPFLPASWFSRLCWSNQSMTLGSER